MIKIDGKKFAKMRFIASRFISNKLYWEYHKQDFALWTVHLCHNIRFKAMNHIVIINL